MKTLVALGTLGILAGFLVQQFLPGRGRPAMKRTGLAWRGAQERVCRNLYETICNAGLASETRDLTGFVRTGGDAEARANRLHDEISRKNPGWSIAQVNDELARRIYTPERRAKIQTAFRWARASIIRFIRSQPGSVFNAREKEVLVQRLEKTQLQLPPPGSLYGDEPGLLTGDQVYYERSLISRKPMRMRVGGLYVLSVTSWFNTVFTIAHELAHSIDPCEIQSAGLAIPAYDRLNACFLQNGLIATPRARLECGKNDQLSETFSDWMAVQVTVEALKQYRDEYEFDELTEATVNAVRDLCEDVPDTEFHPSPKTRIDRIFGAHPGILEVLGCEPGKEAGTYCRF